MQVLKQAQSVAQAQPPLGEDSAFQWYLQSQSSKVCTVGVSWAYKSGACWVGMKEVQMELLTETKREHWLVVLSERLMDGWTEVELVLPKG